MNLAHPMTSQYAPPPPSPDWNLGGEVQDQHSHHDDAEFFAGLLDVLLPGGVGAAVFLQAYFDESGRTGGLFAVAGYAFLPAQARRFDKSWRGMLGSVSAFHMADLVARQGEFKGFSSSQQDKMIRRAVEITNSRIAVGVAGSCSRNDWKALAPPGVKYHGDPYAVLCYLCIEELGRLLDIKGIQGNVAYFFEAGNRFQGEANQLMDLVVKAPEVRRLSRYRSHTFIDKRAATQLQAADLFAWELTKFRDETVEAGIREIRKSYQALLAKDLSRYRTLHAGPDELARYFNAVKEAGAYMP
jgi:hypothetical protein